MRLYDHYRVDVAISGIEELVLDSHSHPSQFCASSIRFHIYHLSHSIETLLTGEVMLIVDGGCNLACDEQYTT